MLHIAPIRRCFTAFAIVAAAAAMTGCEGGMTMTDAATRDTRAELRRSPRAIASGHDRAEQAAAQDREDRAGAGEAASDERAGAEKSKSKDAAKSEAAAAVAAREDREDRDGADHLTLDIGDAVPELYAIVRTPGIDLEFTEGLREPPQSSVVPGPAAWTPDPASAEAPAPVIEDVWPVKTAAAGGEKVVIRGKNLRAAQVLFGLAPARIIQESEESVTVEAPAASDEKVGIVVTNRDGHYAIAAASFEYYN